MVADVPTSAMAAARMAYGVEHELVMSRHEPSIGLGGGTQQPFEGLVSPALVLRAATHGIAAGDTVQEVLRQVGRVRGEDPRAGLGQVHPQGAVPRSATRSCHDFDAGGELGVTVENPPLGLGVRPVGGNEALLEGRLTVLGEGQLGCSATGTPEAASARIPTA